MFELKSIPIDLIDRSSHNPRKHFDDTALNSLADSIARLGVLQPILLIDSAEAGRFEIVAGERRWRASKIANRAEIPAIIVSLEDPTLKEVQLIENLEREQLDPIEEGLAFKAIQEQWKYSDNALAQRLKRSYPFVRSRLDLLKLDEDVQRLVAAGKISISAALELLKLEEPVVQVRLAQEIQDNNLSTIQVTERINSYKFQKQLVIRQNNKNLSMERKSQSLAEQWVVITPQTYDSRLHHRTWDLNFETCSSCLEKGKFLRDDGQVEDVCVKPDCYSSLLASHREARQNQRRQREQERRKSIGKIMNADEITTSHLHYLFWTILNLLGTQANEVRQELGIPVQNFTSEDSTLDKEWQILSNLSDEVVLTNIIRLTATHLTNTTNSQLPKGLKDSLINNFGVSAHLLNEEIITHEVN